MKKSELIKLVREALNTENKSETLDSLHSKIEKLYGRKLEPSQISVMTGKNDNIAKLLSQYRKLKRANENVVKEGEEWPKEIKSRYGEYIFKLAKVMPDRAKYDIIDVENGGKEIGGRVYNTPAQALEAASQLIKPQGGRQSSHFGV